MTKDDVDDLLASIAPKPLPLRQSLVKSAAAFLGPADDSIFAKYRTDPIAYAREVLNVRWLSVMQEKMLNQLVQPQNDTWHGKLAIGTGVNYGKSFSLGIIVNWYYDAWGPCIVPTTAPSQQSVNDLLWKEVRLQRARADAKWGIGPQDFIGPQAPCMRRAPDWWARGYVAAKGENFKGRHVENMLFAFDESVGLSEMYFRMTKGMFKPNTRHLWVCCYNPTNTSSAMYQEIVRQDSDWLVMEMSSLEHPNVLAGLRGEPLPIPAAVSVEQIEEGIKDDCEPIDAEDAQTTDFQWKGRWYKPGPQMEGDYLGRWPSSDETDLWSDALWKAVSAPLKWNEVEIDLDEIPRIGADIAYLGGAKNALHVVWGNYSVHHESKGGQEPMRTVGRLIELAEEWAEKYTKARREPMLEALSPKRIPIKCDDTGIGGGVVSRLREQGFNVWPVGAAEQAMRKNKYPNKRSELWFTTRDRAKAGMVFLGLLPQKTLVEIRKQLLAPTWRLLSTGQRQVEEKEQTQKRLGKSPDDADSINLSYYMVDLKTPEVLHIAQDSFIDKIERAKDGRKIDWRAKRGGTMRRGLFGR